MANEIYLHDHEGFPDLLRIVEEKTGIQAGLIEKDYWIMQALYGLKKLGLPFELKGGTSLSKGYHIIDRFSEDIDIYIHPPIEFGINESSNAAVKPKNIEAKRNFYGWLAQNIKIDGFIAVERDTAFDDKDRYRNGGIRLIYPSKTGGVTGMKEGILLEVGFDDIAPNQPLTISSWAYDEAFQHKELDIIDNRAFDVVCYNPEYSFVEKLQTIATKYRKEQSGEGGRTTRYSNSLVQKLTKRIRKDGFPKPIMISRQIKTRPFCWMMKI